MPLRRGGADLPSRVAEQFFWLGRQAERAESLARLLRIVTLKLTSEADSASLVELPSLLRVLAEGGQIEPGFVVDEIKLAAAGDRAGAAALGVRRSTAARAPRDGEQAGPPGRGGPRPHFARHLADHPADGRAVLAVVDARPTSPTCSRSSTLLLRNLSAFTGLVLENMTRTQAWQFLQLGPADRTRRADVELDPHHAARPRGDGVRSARSAVGSRRQHHDLSLAVSGPRAIGTGARLAADRRIESRGRSRFNW